MAATRVFIHAMASHLTVLAACNMKREKERKVKELFSVISNERVVVRLCFSKIDLHCSLLKSAYANLVQGRISALGGLSGSLD